MTIPPVLSLDVKKVKSAAKAVLKVEPDKVRKLLCSRHSQSFDVSTPKGHFVLTAVAKHLPGRVARQGWSYQACARAKIPVPKVVSIDTKKRLLPHEFMVTSYEPGEYLCDIFPSRPHYRKELGRSVGVALAKVHDIDVKGFGLLSAKGVGEKKSWDSAVFEDFEKDMAYIAKHKLLKPEEIAAVKSMVETRKSWLECKSPVLLHANLDLDNVLAIGNDVSCMSGFGWAKGGDPAREFGQMYSNFYFNRERPFIEAVKVSYETTIGRRLDMRRVWLYCLMDRMKAFRDDIEIDGTEPALAKKYHRTYIDRVMRQVQALD